MANRFLKKVLSVVILSVFTIIGTFRIDFKKILVIYDQNDIEIDFDTEIENNYFTTNFDAYAFSSLQITEYFKWKNEKSCKDYQDFGGYLHDAFKVARCRCTSYAYDLSIILK